MPQFMSVHRAPGLRQEEWVENSVAIRALEDAKFVQAHANLATGFIFTIYEAESADALVEVFEELGLPFEEMHEVQMSQSYDELVQMLEQMGR